MNFIYRWLHDKRTSRLEEESTLGSQRDRQASKDYHGGSEVPNRRMVPSSNAVQIPDPWL